MCPTTMQTYGKIAHFYIRFFIKSAIDQTSLKLRCDDYMVNSIKIIAIVTCLEDTDFSNS